MRWQTVYGQAGRPPFREALRETASPAAAGAQQLHRTVREDAIGAAAIRNDLLAPGQPPKLDAEPLEGNGDGAGDVPGPVLLLRPHVENDDRPGPDSPQEIVAGDGIEAALSGMVGPRDLLHLRHALLGQGADAPCEVEDLRAGEPIPDEDAFSRRFDQARVAQDLKVP